VISYRAAGDIVQSLLALDIDVGAIGSLELDVECRYPSCQPQSFSLMRLLSSPTCSQMVKVLVDQVVGSLADIAERRHRHDRRESLLDNHRLLNELCVCHLVQKRQVSRSKYLMVYATGVVECNQVFYVC